jgi:hypothetical protein
MTHPQTRLGLTISAAAILIPLASASGCGAAGYHPAATGSAAGVRKSEMTTTRQWATMGAKLRAFTVKENATLPKFMRLGKNAVFAYESLPIAITRNGTYTLDYGPTGTGFNFPKSPTVVVTYFPTDIHFTIRPAGGTYMTSIKGSRYLQTSIAVSNLTAPYIHFSAWIY